MAKSSDRSLRFARVRLENWRNFARAEAALQPRVFLVGPNAAGKSNFLDVFRFLHDLVAVGGGFQEAVRRRGGVSRLRCLSARRYSEITIAVDVGDHDGIEWSYELTFTQDNRQRPIVRRELVSRRGDIVLDRPTPEDERDPERLTQTNLEQVNVNSPFRSLADFLESVRYTHLVPQLVRELERSVGRRNDPYGGDFLQQLALTQSRTRDSRLRRIVDALRVAVPQLKELELNRDVRGTPHLRGRYEHWRPQGAFQSEEDLSDGTLRLMGLLWALLDGAGPLLLEEPELSLHPDVVRHIPSMFGRVQERTSRQIMVSTHSVDLLRDSGIGLDEVLLLLPRKEGTEVRVAKSDRHIWALLEGGVSLAEAVVPATRPAHAEQLSLFG